MNFPVELSSCFGKKQFMCSKASLNTECWPTLIRKGKHYLIGIPVNLSDLSREELIEQLLLERGHRMTLSKSK